MKLQEVFDQLTTGEFSQISIGGEPPGVINECNQEKVLAHLSLALTEIYTRFNLREGRIRFTLQGGADTYQIRADDLLKIERVLLDSGDELPINDHSKSLGCFTPNLNTIRLTPAMAAQTSATPESHRTQGLTVVYRANHPRVALKNGFLNPSTANLELPYSHLAPLLYFVASRAHSTVGMTSEFNSSNTWYAKYEAACQGLENKGLQISETEGEDRLHRNGWV